MIAAKEGKHLQSVFHYGAAELESAGLAPQSQWRAHHSHSFPAPTKTQPYRTLGPTYKDGHEMYEVLRSTGRWVGARQTAWEEGEAIATCGVACQAAIRGTAEAEGREVQLQFRCDEACAKEIRAMSVQMYKKVRSLCLTRGLPLPHRMQRRRGGSLLWRAQLRGSRHPSRTGYA